MNNQQSTPVAGGMSLTSLLVLIAAAVGLAALIFGLGGVSVGMIAVWIVMVAAVASTLMLYARSTGGLGPMKK